MVSKDKEIQLPKKFFHENPVKEFSAAQFTYFQITIMDLPELNKRMDEIVISTMENERRVKYEEEKKKILEISNADDVINCMRKMKDLQNRKALLDKALTMQADVIPLVLKRLKTSGHDVFIENAALLLAHADMEYVEQLCDMFREIHNPYARSEASLVFGIKKEKKYTALLLDQFEMIKKEAPGKDYEQGPLLALHLIYDE